MQGLAQIQVAMDTAELQVMLAAVVTQAVLADLVTQAMELLQETLGQARHQTGQANRVVPVILGLPALLETLGLTQLVVMLVRRLRQTGLEGSAVAVTQETRGLLAIAEQVDPQEMLAQQRHRTGQVNLEFQEILEILARKATLEI